ncbi:Cell division cycle-associated 7-like protein [Galemys pyrenaicus]|uniref:Cell division cycle-associated 7-like protein n=1 Tax=Galemys pyrenaicus TaxID=202257 RepID=A0A8J6A3I7_GALPY|nr:Cell division cycle-associated 7-like protein [Galemys pyrenaicus]
MQTELSPETENALSQETRSCWLAGSSDRELGFNREDVERALPVSATFQPKPFAALCPSSQPAQSLLAQPAVAAVRGRLLGLASPPDCSCQASGCAGKVLRAAARLPPFTCVPCTVLLTIGKAGPSAAAGTSSSRLDPAGSPGIPKEVADIFNAPSDDEDFLGFRDDVPMETLSSEESCDSFDSLEPRKQRSCVNSPELEKLHELPEPEKLVSSPELEKLRELPEPEKLCELPEPEKLRELP